MSYDIEIHQCGNHSGCDVDDVGCIDVGNHTSNTVPMWTHALGFPLREMDGRSVYDCIGDLARAISVMRAEENAAIFQAMTPDNKWGKPETALAFLVKFLEACERCPKGVVRIYT